MIIGVSLNPSIDRTLSLEAFVYGETNRVVHSDVHYAGKTFNTLRILSALGEKTHAIGVLGRENGAAFIDSLGQSGVICDAIWTPYETRTNIKLLDKSTRTITEINEHGAPLPNEAISEIAARLKAFPPDALVLLSGRLPPQSPGDTYARIMRAVGGERFIVDTEGDALTSALPLKPLLVKPNRAELEQAAGKPLPALEDVLLAARSLLERGARKVCVSLGAQGALLADNEQTWFAPALPIPVTSTVGAGDAMVAGLITARGKPLCEQLRMGMACSAASIAGNRTLTRESVEALLAQVQLRQIA